MQTRPRYSTGFRVFVCGVITFLLGALAIAYDVKVVGDTLMVLGFLAFIWFRYPSSWEKTWPDDFPRLARAVGIDSQPDRWAPTPQFWDTATPQARLKRGAVCTVGGLALMGWGLVHPLDWHDYGAGTGAAVVGALIAWFGFREFRRARRDRPT
jgi:hypothetical protein